LQPQKEGVNGINYLKQVYELGEAKSKDFIEKYLCIPVELIEECKQELPEFSFKNCFQNLVCIELLLFVLGSI
jgi:hypothetical protein